MLGASGAIAAVLGAYWVLYPDTKILMSSLGGCLTDLPRLMLDTRP
jgi:membrane associated rhomboid family serine protease